MTRNILASRWFLEIYLDGATTRWCDGFSDTDFDGQTYTALGDRWSPPARIRRQADLTSQTLKLTFDSSRQTDNTDLIGALLDENWRRRQVRLRQVLMQVGQTADQGDVIVDERGRIRNLQDTIEVGRVAELEMEIESGVLAYLERRMQTRSAENQRAIFPDDSGFDLSLIGPRLGIVWGRSPVGYDTTYRGPFGVSSGSETPEDDDPPAREMALGWFSTSGTFVQSNTYGANENGNAIFQRVVALADHQIEALDEVWVDDQMLHYSFEDGTLQHGVRTLLARNLTQAEIDSGHFKGYWVTFYDGRPDQVTSTPFFPQDDWRDTRVLKGVAYAIIEVYDPDYNAEAPDVRFVGRGARLYDRRADSTAGGNGPQRADDPDTWVYSLNPMVALDHYRIGRRIMSGNSAMWFGVGEAADALPFDEFKDVADHCDEWVELKDGTNQRRYEVSGFLSAANDHKKNFETLASAMGARVIDQGGRISIRPIRSSSPVFTLDDSDLDAASKTIASPGGRIDDLANGVEGRFYDWENYHSRNDYPRVSDESYIVEDGDEIVITRDFDLEKHGERAQRLAKLALKESRRIFTIEDIVPLTKARRDDGGLLQPGDWYTRLSALRGFPDGKLFEIDEIDRSIDGTAKISGFEVDPSDDAWVASEAKDLSPPVLPALRPVTADIPAPTLSVIEKSAGGTITPAVQIVFPAPAQFEDTVNEFAEVELQIVGDANSKQSRIVDGKVDKLVVTGLLPSTQYQFRFRGRARNAISDWSDASLITTTANFTAGSATSVVWSGVTGAGRPSDNADVTGSNVAAGITGQGALATSGLGEGDVSNSVIRSEAQRASFIPSIYDVLGGDEFISGQVGLTLINCSGFSSAIENPWLGRNSIGINGDLGEDDYRIRFSPANDSNFYLPQGKYGYRIQFAASASISQIRVVLRGHDFSYSQVGDHTTWTNGEISGVFNDSDFSTPDVQLEIRVTVDGSASARIFKPFRVHLESVPDTAIDCGQFPALPDGKLASVARGADVTGSNVAAGITGQGVLATSGLGEGDVENSLLDGAIDAAADTALWPNVTGSGRPADNADVTGSNVAAGITGQGPLATSGLGEGDVSNAPLIVDIDENSSRIVQRSHFSLPYGFSDLRSAYTGEGDGSPDSVADISAIWQKDSNSDVAILTSSGGFDYLRTKAVLAVQAGDKVRIKIPFRVISTPSAPAAGPAIQMVLGVLAEDYTGSDTIPASSGDYNSSFNDWSILHATYTVSQAGYVRAGLYARNVFPAGSLIAVAPFQAIILDAVQEADIDAAADTALWPSVTGAGRPADNADVTGSNVAAGITGQGALATSGLGEGDVENSLLDGAIDAAADTALWPSVTGSGRPADNADVTGSNVAAGITGQGPLATSGLGEGDVSNSVIRSEAQRASFIPSIYDVLGGDEFISGQVGLTLINCSGFSSGVQNPWINRNSIGCLGDPGRDDFRIRFSPNNTDNFYLPAGKYGYRIHFSANSSISRIRVVLRGHDNSYNLVGDHTGFSGGEISGVFDDSAFSTGAVQFEIRVTVDGSAEFRVFYPFRVHLESVPDAATDCGQFPALPDGKLASVARGADVTGSNVAAGITGQGALATSGLGEGDVENSLLDGAIDAAADTALWPNVTGSGRPADNADVTGSNVAAGITGQGALATSGLGEGDVENSLLDSDIDAAADTALWPSVTGSGRPADNADVTGSNVASGITGQGALATLSTAARKKYGSFSTEASPMGFSIADSDGNTVSFSQGDQVTPVKPNHQQVASLSISSDGSPIELEWFAQFLKASPGSTTEGDNLKVRVRVYRSTSIIADKMIIANLGADTATGVLPVFGGMQRIVDQSPPGTPPAPVNVDYFLHWATPATQNKSPFPYTAILDSDAPPYFAAVQLQGAANDVS